MIDPTSDTGKRLASLSARLRVLHSELASESEDIRHEQIRDEVQRVLATLQPGEREPFLKSLMEQFPVWNDGVVAQSASQPVVRSAAPAPEIKDPRVLAERLAEASRGLNPAERADIVTRLATAGLVQERQVVVAGGGGGDAGPAASAQELRKVLGLGQDAEVLASRASELAVMLTEFVVKLEPWAVQYWRDVAPDAKVQVYQVLQKEMSKFLAGDASVNREALGKSLFRLRSLVSLLRKGVVESGRQFSRDHLSRFSVDAIRGQAGSGSLLESADVKCWKQYVRQMEGVDAASMEKRLKGLLAQDVDAGMSQVVR